MVVETSNSGLVDYSTGIVALVIKDGAIKHLALGSASAVNVGSGVGQVPVIGTSGLLPAAIIPGGGGSGAGLPADGDVGQMIFNTGPGVGTWGTFTYSGASIVAALQGLDSAAIKDYQASMHPDFVEGDIPVKGSDGTFEPLAASSYTTDANTFLYFNDDGKPVALTHAEMMQVLSGDARCVVSSESGSVTLAFTPGITDLAGWRSNVEGSITLNSVPGLREGRAAPWVIVQDAIGNRTLTLGSGVQWMPGSAQTINTGANERTELVIKGGEDDNGTRDADVYVSVVQSVA